MIHLLLEAGAVVNARNNYGYTPLIQSAMSGHSETVIAMLLKAGADVNTADHEGVTALHYAALPEPEDRPAALGIMRLLLEYKANPTLRDKKGMSPLDHAGQNGHTEIAELLRASQLGM